MHLQTAILRIAQGAMANVIQHSGAARATISLDQGGGTVRLIVADDGRGFDQSAVARAGASGTSGSFGLTATRERVDQLGGRLTVEAAPGRGTTITVDLDLDDS
jgi:signal transduction histidine kinase